MQKKIPRLVISATQSGSGKTTIVTGILTALRSRGLKVQSYKIGPDYIDTSYHSLATDRPAHNLDTWLVPEDKLQEIFAYTSKDVDIAIIEGVMGLYDGGKNGISSTAEIAKLLKIPVILVIDAKSIGASAAAIALGFREYDKNINLAGVILNRIGSDNHRQMIENALNKFNIKCFGAIKRDNNLVTPERHLGLLPTYENETAELIKNIEKAVSSQVDIDELIRIANDTDDLKFQNHSVLKIPNFKLRIGIAKDEAFNFYYPESLRVLENFGAGMMKSCQMLTVS